MYVIRWIEILGGFRFSRVTETAAAAQRQCREHLIYVVIV